MTVEANNFATTPVLTLSVRHADTDEVWRRFVTTAGTRAGAGAQVLGVARVKSTTEGDIVPVDVAGVAVVVAGAAIAADAHLASDAQGRAVTRAEPVSEHAVVDGAAADTDIAVTGIATTDTLDAIVATDGTALGAVSIHSDGNVRCANATTGKKLLVVWHTPAAPSAGRALAAAAAAGDHLPALIGAGG